MTFETFSYIKKYRNEMSLNIGELIKGTKKPKPEHGKIPWHNEINENQIDIENGICVFCGKTSNNLMSLDLDDEGLLEHFKLYVNQTWVTKTKRGYQILFRTYDAPKSRSLTNGKGQHIDLLGQGKIAILPPTKHPDTGKPYEIYSDKKIKYLSRTEERGLYQILQNLGFCVSNQKMPVKELHEKNFVKSEGQNRAEDLLRVIDSWKIKNPEFTEDILFTLAVDYNMKHFEPPYSEDKVRNIVTQGFEFGEKILTAKLSHEETEDQTLSKKKDLIDKTVLKIRSELNIITNRETKEILIHTGKIYAKNNFSQSIIEERAEKIIDNCTTHERNEVVNKIKAQTGANVDEFDKDSNLICINNGILNIQTIEVEDHNPGHLSCILLPVEYHEPKYKINNETIFEDIEKNLKDTLFWKFLKSSFTINEIFRQEEFETVLEIIASFFIKQQIDEKAFMFLGRGENGKSVLTEYIENMLGRENIEKIQLQDLSEDKFMCAKLVGKLANIFADLEPDELKHTGKIKSIASGEGIEVQEKYGKPFKLYPFSKLLFSCNRFPRVYDQSQGFFRRWIIVKWTRNFENDPERDSSLKEKLKSNYDEKCKVFSSLIYLSRKLLHARKFSHSKNWNVIQNEWNANADPIDDFVSNYIIDSDANRGVRETYSFYKQIMLSKQERPLGIGQFGKVFREYFDQEVIKEDNKSKRM